MRLLIGEFVRLKPKMPSIFLTRADDVRGEANQYMRDFMEAFTRAGISVANGMQAPGGPDETGVMISVPEIAKPPEVAVELAAALSKAGITSHIVPKPPTFGGEFTLFIGHNPL